MNEVHYIVVVFNVDLAVFSPHKQKLKALLKNRAPEVCKMKG